MQQSNLHAVHYSPHAFAVLSRQRHAALRRLAATAACRLVMPSAGSGKENVVWPIPAWPSYTFHNLDRRQTGRCAAPRTSATAGAELSAAVAARHRCCAAFAAARRMCAHSSNGGDPTKGRSALGSAGWTALGVWLGPRGQLHR